MKIRSKIFPALCCIAAGCLAAAIGVGMGELFRQARGPEAHAATPLIGHQPALAYTGGVTTNTFVKLQTASATVPVITTSTAATDNVIGVCTRTQATANGLTRYAPIGTMAPVTAGEAIAAGTWVVSGTSGYAYAHSPTTGGQRIVGRALNAAASAGTVYVDIRPFIVEEATSAAYGRTYTRVTGDITIADANQSGRLYRVDANATITLPAPVTGMTYEFFNGGAAAGVEITLQPASGDAIVGMGTTGTTDKGLINTLATAVKGDFVGLRASSDANTWYITRQSGTWAWAE